MKYRSYTSEFKEQAVQLAESIGSTAEAAKQLGISPSHISWWRKKTVEQSMPEEPGMQAILDELKTLRRENDNLKKVNHILKGAAAFFSQDYLK